MCFSAEADLVAGLVITGLGVDAVRHVRRRAERLLAALPVVLGLHQLVEALVWWGLRGDVGDAVWRPAATAYLLIAFGVVPVLVPAAVAALEPATRAARAVGFTGLGLVVATVLTTAVLRGPVEVSIVGRHLEYGVGLSFELLLVGGYVLATCGSLLLSSHAHVRWFGLANLVAVGLLAWLDRSAFISLWCAWAAVTSGAIAWHLRRVTRRQPIPASPDSSLVGSLVMSSWKSAAESGRENK